MKPSRNQQIALAGLFCALQALAVLLNLVLPLELVIMLFSPILSALFIRRASWSMVVAYLIATTLLCSLIDLPTALLYTVPALITGSLIGLLKKHACPDWLTFLCTSLNCLLLIYLTNALVSFFYRTDYLHSLKQLFATSDSFLFFWITLIALAQAFICLFIVLEEWKRLPRKK